MSPRRLRPRRRDRSARPRSDGNGKYEVQERDSGRSPFLDGRRRSPPPARTRCATAVVVDDAGASAVRTLEVESTRRTYSRVLAASTPTVARLGHEVMLAAPRQRPRRERSRLRLRPRRRPHLPDTRRRERHAQPTFAASPLAVVSGSRHRRRRRRGDQPPHDRGQGGQRPAHRQLSPRARPRLLRAGQRAGRRGHRLRLGSNGGGVLGTWRDSTRTPRRRSLVGPWQSASTHATAARPRPAGWC